MKKFYVLCFAALLAFVQVGKAQTYTALFSGNWSDNSIWGVSGIPSNPCTNCTITINDGVFVTLDISFKMIGSSQLLIGSAGSFASALVIPTTNASSISTGHNLILNSQGGGNPTVKIVSALSSLSVTQLPSTTGYYDGVFTQNATDFSYIKIVGVRPIFVSSDGVTLPIPPSVPIFPAYGTSLPNSSFPAPFTLNANGTLPIFLSSFDAVLNGKVVSLTWTSEIEINSDHYGVERSSDAVTWTNIGTVAAKGNTTSSVHYSFTDQGPNSGVNYYRLKMVDIDGKFKYSEVKVVRLSQVLGYNLFPNPANNYLNISIGKDMPANGTLRLFNLNGQLMQEKKLTNATGTTVSLQVNTYPAGVYLVRIISDNGKENAFQIVIAR